MRWVMTKRKMGRSPPVATICGRLSCLRSANPMATLSTHSQLDTCCGATIMIMLDVRNHAAPIVNNTRYERRTSQLTLDGMEIGAARMEKKNIRFMNVFLFFSSNWWRLTKRRDSYKAMNTLKSYSSLWCVNDTVGVTDCHRIRWPTIVVSFPNTCARRPYRWFLLFENISINVLKNVFIVPFLISLRVTWWIN